MRSREGPPPGRRGREFGDADLIHKIVTAGSATTRCVSTTAAPALASTAAPATATERRIRLRIDEQAIQELVDRLLHQFDASSAPLSKA